MKFLILNGPNLNFLGIREPHIYGTMTYPQLVELLHEQARALSIEITCVQSNSEGALVDEIQRAYGCMDAIIINPAAYTHTSIAILDALRAVGLPAAEVHLSDPAAREPFRHISYAGMACQFHFAGEGAQGYVRAMRALKDCLRR